MIAPSLPDAAAEFPLRVAAIDVGSNAIRYLAAEFLDARHWVEIEAQRVPVRLGHKAFLTGLLDENAMSAAVAAMSAFRRSIDAHGVGLYRAVATSAVRESRNGGELVERIRRESGIRLETISGSEEARLVAAAVRARLPLSGGSQVLADLGGGSLEVSLLNADGVIWSESHTIGTVRLIEEFASADASPAEMRKLLEEYLGTLRFPDLPSDAGGGSAPGGMIATGGNIEALVKLAGILPGADRTSVLPLGALRSAIAILADLSCDERIDRFGLKADRADVILPAALVFARVAELAGVDEIVVPHVGVKEGVLLDLVDDSVQHAVHQDRQERDLVEGAAAIGRRFHFDESHGRQVARLALLLFDQLGLLHGLENSDRRILLAAALLHDIGQFLAYRKHHKHSCYLIFHSELPGLTGIEVPLAALVARYHRGADPEDNHEIYRDLMLPDRERVRKLAALLRIGDSLDREHHQRVRDLQVDLGDGEVVLRLVSDGDLLLERWALQKKGKLFESVFRKSLVVEGAPVV